MMRTFGKAARAAPGRAEAAMKGTATLNRATAVLLGSKIESTPSSHYLTVVGRAATLRGKRGRDLP